jgi:hypothetical protein
MIELGERDLASRQDSTGEGLQRTVGPDERGLDAVEPVENDFRVLDEKSGGMYFPAIVDQPIRDGGIISGTMKRRGLAVNARLPRKLSGDSTGVGETSMKKNGFWQVATWGFEPPLVGPVDDTMPLRQGSPSDGVSVREHIGFKNPCHLRV